MDMLPTDRILAADLPDWRKLGQGLHARYRLTDFGQGARFATAVAEAAGEHPPRMTIGEDFVDVKVISPDAVYRDGEGAEHLVEWVTELDVEVAARISAAAGNLGLRAEPDAITTIELALDTPDSAAVAPFWSALLTGGDEARGRGTLGDDVRDATGRVPIVWFQDSDDPAPARQRFHLDVWVAPEVAATRIAAAVAAGGTVVEASQAPSYTVLVDADGNRACVCTTLDPADR